MERYEENPISDLEESEISCGSSPFEDGEEESSQSDHSVNTVDADGAVESMASIRSIVPYQFEPYLSNSDDGDEDENIETTDRLLNNSWCVCGHCVVMPTARECLCCSEVDKVTNVWREIPGAQCITNHPGFHSVCLDVYVLQVAYYQYRQQYGERPEQDNAKLRYTAYRQFVRWCWQFLGKEVRVIIPSCVFLKIRTAFPDDDQNYVGFHEGDSD